MKKKDEIQKELEIRKELLQRAIAKRDYHWAINEHKHKVETLEWVLSEGD